jgi:hypothetical protein
MTTIPWLIALIEKCGLHKKIKTENYWFSEKRSGKSEKHQNVSHSSLRKHMQKKQREKTSTKSFKLKQQASCFFSFSASLSSRWRKFTLKQVQSVEFLMDFQLSNFHRNLVNVFSNNAHECHWRKKFCFHIKMVLSSL